jgi:hypothetical protein
MPKKPVQPKAGKSAANYPALSDNEEDSQIELSKAQRLDNTYAEYLCPNNTKSERLLSLEHRVVQSSLQWRIKGRKTKAAETENRQRLTHLEEDALKDWCL